MYLREVNYIVGLTAVVVILSLTTAVAIGSRRWVLSIVRAHMLTYTILEKKCDGASYESNVLSQAGETTERF